MRAFELMTADGATLRGRAWTAEKPRAICVLVHGLGEHTGRYDHVGAALAAKGVSLYGADLRGHGLSDGRRGHAPSYAALMDDLGLLLGKARAAHPNTPTFLFGHSLGGNIAMVHAMKRRPDIAGVIVTAPLLRLAFEPPAWKLAAMRIVNALRWVITLPNGLDDRELSRDDQVAQTKRSDPLAHGWISSRLAADMLEHGHWLMEHAAEFPYPILLSHGDADHVTSCAATRAFAAALRVEHDLKIWPFLKHEPFNEPEKADVIALMIDWIQTKIATNP